MSTSLNVRKVEVGFIVFGALVFAGCGTSERYRPLIVNDTVLMPSFRLSKNVFSPGGPAARSEPEEGLSVEFGVMYAGGNDSVPLSTGEVRLGAQTFVAPQNFALESDLTAYDISARWRETATDRIGVEAYGGFEYLRVDIAASTETVGADESISSPVFRFGFAPYLKVLQTTRIEGFATFHVSNGNFNDSAQLGTSLVQTLGRYARVRVGYWIWKIEAPSSSRSRINLDLRGPLVGLDLNF